MEKKKYIIIGTVVVLVLIIATVFMFKGKQPKEGDAKNLSESSSIDGEEEEERNIYPAQGDSEKTTEEIDDYIPNMKANEIQEIISKKMNEEQKESIDQALKSNEITLKNQKWEEVIYSDSSLASMQEIINYNLSTMFNEFLVDAQLGKYEYEKIGAMLDTYASDLEQDIKNSNTKLQ